MATHSALRRFASYVQEALKTWRKKNAAMLLATQSIDDFASVDLLRTVVESCPTRMLLANPSMNRDQYRELLQMNEMELDLLASLAAAPPGAVEAGELREGPRSECRSEELLDLHEHTNRQRTGHSAFRELGFAAGLDRLAATA